MELFTLNDFKVFDLDGFSERMAAIATRIRPKLASIGRALEPKISELVDVPLYLHVARHARRTVNPPDDTWAALGANPRGYKQDVHFKIAISRQCVRFLFEAGPEYYAKSEWVDGWRRQLKHVSAPLRTSQNLAWFKNEHDEAPATPVSALTPSDLNKIGDELTRRKDGQFVLGRRVDAKEFVRLDASHVEKIAVKTFKSLAPLFQLHDARVVA